MLAGISTDLLYGKDRDGRISGLCDPVVPTTARSQSFPGPLVHFNYVSGVVLDVVWSHKEVSDVLRGWFPMLFEYFDTLPVSEAPHWLLCSKERQRLHIVPDLTPNGEKFAINKGTKKAKFHDNFIYLGELLLRFGAHHS